MVERIKVDHSKELSFDHLCHQYYQRLVSFAQSYVHDPMEAEDIATDALIKYWQSQRQDADNISVSMLFVILRNLCLDWLKHEAIRQKADANLALWQKQDLEFRISSMESCDPKIIFSQEVQDIIDRTLSKMPETSRRCFYLSREEGMNNKDIAKAVGLSVKGVQYHITKVLKALREAMKDYLPFYWFLFVWTINSLI